MNSPETPTWWSKPSIARPRFLRGLGAPEAMIEVVAHKDAPKGSRVEQAAHRAIVRLASLYAAHARAKHRGEDITATLSDYDERAADLRGQLTKLIEQWKEEPGR